MREGVALVIVGSVGLIFGYLVGRARRQRGRLRVFFVDYNEDHSRRDDEQPET